jgi:hypothetical protein
VREEDGELPRGQLRASASLCCCRDTLDCLLIFSLPSCFTAQVVLPWLVCIPFYTGQGFSSIVNWGGIIFNSTVNFIIPPLIYVAMVRRQQQRAVEVANRLGLEKIVFDDNGELEQSSPRVSSGYVPPGSSNQNDTPVGVGSMTVKVTRATSVQASASPPAASVKSSASLLGPRKDLDASASLKQGLLSSGGNYSGSGAYHASDLDIRSAEEEAKDNELLGYDPVEEERIEREQIEEEVLRKMSQQHHHPGGSHSLQHPGATASGPSANMRRAEEVLSPSDSIDGTNAHEFHVHSLGWQAMPQWVRPWRIHMALGVAGFLTLVALTVVALNIQQCATGNGC